MKKKVSLLVSLLTLLISIISLSACSNIAPFAYTTYKTIDNQVAYYDSTMNGVHIYIFENESMMPDGSDEKYKDNNELYRSDCVSNAIITIGFKSSFGSETVAGSNTILVDIDKWYYIEVTVKKDSNIYSADKSVYLNNDKLVKSGKNDSIFESDSIIIYHFEDCGLNRSNPNGKIREIINTIEYK